MEAESGVKDGFSSVFEGHSSEDEKLVCGLNVRLAPCVQDKGTKKRGTLLRQDTGRNFRVGKISSSDAKPQGIAKALGNAKVQGDEVEKAGASNTRGGGLPAFKACQLKLARTWDSLQRRMARRSAAVHKHNVDDKPLLLAAAEDLPPEIWEQDVDRWPEVAKESARLPRSVSPDSAAGDSQFATQSISLLEASSSVTAYGTSLLWSTTISDGDGLKTPPYARSPVPPDQFDELEQESINLQSMSHLSSEEAEERRHDILRKKARKRLHAPPPSPPPPVREQVIGKLQYLHTCREVMGESRYQFERRRLELQSDVKGVNKYTASEAAPSKVEQEQHQLATRPAVVPEIKSQVLGGQRMLNWQKAGEDVAQPTSSRHAHAMAAFEYGRLCRERKITMPILGSFAVNTHKEASPLCVDNWSLGDAPLLALAKSPWRKALAAAGHCRLRGNRLTNDGVAAVIESLGMEIATLDLADNLFDALGAEVLVKFISRGPHHLRELDVSRNHLGDRIVASLCQELLHECPHILQLGLADVQLGAGLHSGPALGSLLQGSDSLAALNVSYNMLQGEAAYALLNGVYENGTNGSGELRHLDLSWNCLGQGPICKRVAQKLGAVLREGRTLLHLDLSFNQFCQEACAILAREVHDNHTLWGLHMDGNSAIVDADGFIRILEDMTPESCYQGAPAPALRAGKRGKKKKKQKPKQKKKKKKGLGQEEAWHAWLRQCAKEASALREFNQWQISYTKQEEKRDAERAAFEFGAFQGFWLPEELCENPGCLLPGDGQELGLKTRVMPPRLQEEWLHVLTLDIREELRAGWTFGNNNTEGNLGGPSPIRRCRTPPTRDRSSSPGGEVGAGAASRRDPGATERLTECLAPSCWLCNGWVEVNFLLTPEISISELATATNVCAFVSVDNFSRPTILKQEADGRFEGSRFMPPTDEPMLVVFQVDDHLEVAGDLAQQRLAKVLRIALYGQGSDKDTGGANPGSGAEGASTEDARESASPVIAEIQEANLLFVASLAEIRLAELEARGEPMLLSKVPEELRLSKAPPRQSLPVACPATVTAAPKWCLAASVWALHPDIYNDKTHATLAKCFERDWQLVRSKLSNRRALSEVDSLRPVLHKYFPLLLRTYQRLSTNGRSDKDPGITLGVYTQTLSDSGLLAAHPQHNVNYFDSVFAACQFVPKDCSAKAAVLCPDGLVRWQFVEMIARLGEACRISDAKRAAAATAAGSTAGKSALSGSAGYETLSQAVARILSAQYGPMSSRDDEEVKRFRKALFVERIDKIFKAHMVELKSSYEFFTDSGRLAGKQRSTAGGDSNLAKRSTVRAAPRRALDNRNTMSRSEWQVYLQELKVIDNSFEERLVAYAFAMGAALNPNEASNMKHLELSFVEFLVALGYVLWVRAGRVGGAALEDCVDAVFTEKLTDLYHQVLEWQNSPLLAKLRQQSDGSTPILRKLGVGIPWLHGIQSLLQRLFRMVDDDFDGNLSFRELSGGFARQDAQQEFAKLGIEPAHIEEFYKVVDIESTGSVTLAEAVVGMARVKERLKSAEPALRFLRELFTRPTAGDDTGTAVAALTDMSFSRQFSSGSSIGGRVSGGSSQVLTRQVTSSSERTSVAEAAPVLNQEDAVSSSDGFDVEQPVYLATFKEAAANLAVQEQMRQLGMACNLMALWEYLESEYACYPVPGVVGAVPTEGRAVRLGEMLNGYLNFSDPAHSVGRATGILRQIFLEYDEDRSGSLSHNEWMALLSNKQLLKRMQRTGLLDDMEDQEQALEESLSMLFHKIDQDSSGALTIDEVLSGFLAQWQMVRQRKIEAMSQAGTASSSSMQVVRSSAKRPTGTRGSTTTRSSRHRTIKGLSTKEF